jgi:TonB family protein
MFWRLLTIATMVVFAQGAELVGPSEFYVVSQFFSDNGAQFYYRVIDVKQDGSDSVIRYVRIAPTNVYCRRLIIQAAEARVRDKSPAQLAGRNNPCAVKPTALRAALGRYRQRGGVFETISFGIVAQCGHSSVSLRLPHVERVNLEKMKSSDPATVRLWDLSSEITASVFGPDDIFQDRSEQDDLVLQRAGEKLAPELISGRYDSGLATAVKGNVGTWKAPSFRSLLASYQGPITVTEAKANYVPQLLNATAYHFSHFVAPKYPPLAMQARIQGKVELQLTVGSATGEVRSASAVSGHPLLTPPAIDAAAQWRFEANSVSSETVNVTIEYTLRCQ